MVFKKWNTNSSMTYENMRTKTSQIVRMIKNKKSLKACYSYPMIMTSYFAEKIFTGKVEADVGVSRP